MTAHWVHTVEFFPDGNSAVFNPTDPMSKTLLKTILVIVVTMAIVHRVEAIENVILG